MDPGHWQQDTFARIISNPTGVYKLVIPRRFGKTHLLLRLQTYFIGQGKRVNVYTTSLRTREVYEANGYIHHHENPDVILVDDFDFIKHVLPLIDAALCILTTSEHASPITTKHTTLIMSR